MAVHDELAGLRSRRREPEAIEDVVQPELERLQELRPTAGAIVCALELPFAQTVEALRPLLLPKPRRVLGRPLPASAVLARGIRPALERTLARKQARAFQFQLDTLTARQPLDRPEYRAPSDFSPSCHVSRPSSRTTVAAVGSRIPTERTVSASPLRGDGRGRAEGWCPGRSGNQIMRRLTQVSEELACLPANPYLSLGRRAWPGSPQLFAQAEASLHGVPPPVRAGDSVARPRCRPRRSWSPPPEHLVFDPSAHGRPERRCHALRGLGTPWAAPDPLVHAPSADTFGRRASDRNRLALISRIS